MDEIVSIALVLVRGVSYELVFHHLRRIPVYFTHQTNVTAANTFANTLIRSNPSKEYL